MKTSTQTWFRIAIAISVLQAIPANAQRPDGWRRVGDSGTPPPQQEARQQFPEPPESRPLEAGVPPDLRVPAGTWITVRVNEPISSDHNQPGDQFTATLAQPIVAQGRVVARRGQTVAGRVVEVQKGGHVKGTSRLGIELTELSLVDGQQLPIRTQFTQRRGDTSVGRDAAAIGTATGVGAMIGAAADGGFGAGMGAIAGAAASTIGVLVTRGTAAAVYPETLLTFRLEEPLLISTEHSYQAFQPAAQETYEPRNTYEEAPPPRMQPRPYYARAYPAAYPQYGYYPPYPGYFAPYYGPSLFFYSGPRFGYYGRGAGYRGYGYRHR